MTDFEKDRFALRERIERQRHTIARLKREGHDCPDAERQLQQLLLEMQASETGSSRSQAH